MKKGCLQVIIWLSLIANVCAQTCIPDTLVLSSQQQIDDFPTDYPGCTQVLGTLIVSAPDLDNLDGLSQLNIIDGHLEFDNILITDLTGISTGNLNQVGGHISFQNNAALTNLNGIIPWLNLADELIVDNNALLTDMSGMEALNTLDLDFKISNNPLLDSLTGMDNITSFFGILTIENNPSLISIHGLHGITAYNGDFDLSYNTALTDLSAFADLTTFNGNVIIRGCSAITELSGLQSLVIVNDDLRIEDNDGLTNLEGLNNVTTVGDLFIIGNENLTTLSGLNNLETIAGDLEIVDNASLENLDGLEKIEMVSDDLLLEDLPSINNFSGLKNLKTVGKNLEFTDISTNILNLSDLDSLQFIGNRLDIKRTAFANLNGLEKITSLGARLYLHNNDFLIDLTALQNLTSIGAELAIRFSGDIQSMDGLHNIDPNSITNLELNGNSMLEFCSLPNICVYLANGGPSLILDNATNCNDELEILASCVAEDPFVSGKVYFDINNDCIDNSEDGVNDAILRFSSINTTLYTTSNNDGEYDISIPAGDYTVEVINFKDDCWNICTSPTNITVEENQEIILDFAIVSTVACPKMTIDVASGSLLPCVTTVFEVNYCNKGSIAADSAYIEFTLGDDFTFIGSSVTPSAAVGQTYRFDFLSVPANTCNSFNVIAIYDPTCDSFVTGQTACVQARIYPDTLCQSPSVDWDQSSLEVSGVCVNDSIRFTIKNVGDAQMTSAADFIIIEDNIMFRIGSIDDLVSQEEFEIRVPASGKTVRFQVMQSANHPGQSRPNVTIEGCDPDGDGLYSLGYYLQWPQDDADDHIDIECFEVIETALSNNKTTDPLGISELHCLKNEIPLEYVIHFQNNGTDTVGQVIIQDDISSLLDLSSIQPGSSSHPYDFEVTGAGVAQFTFNNIELVDSNTDELASHGFVSFKIWQTDGNPIGSLIENDAQILFDSVLTANTETVTHTVEETYCIDTMLVGIPIFPDDLSLLVYPNPLESFTLFEWSNSFQIPTASISIYDITGRLVKTLPLPGQSAIFHRGDLPAGIYVYQITALDYPPLAQGKLTLF